MKDYLTITDMADIHRVSRQTLIYYDKIDLFKPDHIDDNGYRYYSPYQIPILREIYFLKTIGIKLEDIKNHIRNRNLNNAISLLEYHRDIISNEIATLVKTREFIQQRLRIYSEVNGGQFELFKPAIVEFPERKGIFVPFENKICKMELHLTLMKAWNILIKNGMLPSEKFGTLIINDSIEKELDFKGAGIFVSLPFADTEMENSLTLPDGQYACMYKYAMPYELEYVYMLLDWINANNYKITGNIFDACLLDTTFYGEDKNVDFCQLQIPVEKIL